MAKQASASRSDGIPDYIAVFIDTSLDTHLITVVSPSDTVSDLKKKVLYEHAVCFPHIGEIKIHGLKVKRRGKFYHLSESMLVKSVFHGVNKSWFINVDASSLEVVDGNRNFVDPLPNNLLANALDNRIMPKSPNNPALLNNFDDRQLQKQIDSSEGVENISKGGISDKPGSILPEERAVETTLVEEDKRKRKRNHDKFAPKVLNADVPESGISGSERAIDEAIAEPIKNSSPEAINKDRGTIVQRITIQSERTSEVEKVVELSNAELRDSSADVLMNRSLENNPQSEPSAKRRRGIKQANKGGEDLLKGDGTLVSKSNKVMLEHSTISQKSLVDEQCRTAILDGSSNITPEEVHLKSAGQSNRRGRKRKSAKTSIQEATAVSSSIPNEGVEHFGMRDDSNLSEKPAAALASVQCVPDATNPAPGAPDAINLKHKQGDTAEETNLSPYSLETGTRNKEAGHLEDEHEASRAAVELNIKRMRASEDQRAILAEDNSCAEIQASDKTEKVNGVSRHGNEIHNSYQHHSSKNNNGVEEHQNHVSGENGRVNEEREVAQEFSRETASSEKFKISPHEDLQLRANEIDVGLKSLGADVNGDLSKSSKKRKKSKKTMDLAGVMPPTSVNEQDKFAKSDHPINTLRMEESDRFPEARRDMDTVNTFLAAGKDISDVIQNAVDSVEQMEKDEVGTESIHGNSRKKSRKKKNSDAKLLPESTKQTEHIVTSNAKQTEHSSEVTKKDTDTTKHSVGSLVAEKDQGIQSAQFMIEKPESNSNKRCPEAVVRCSQSGSGRANEVTGDVEASRESSGVNFSDYFAPKKHDLETLDSSKMLVDETNANGAPGTVKAKKKRKSKKHDAHSDGPSPGSKTPLMLNNSHEVGAEPRTVDFSSAEVQVSFEKANTVKTALKSNKKPSKDSDIGAEPLLSSKPYNVYSVPEEARRSSDANPSVIINDSKSKKADSNLKSSNTSSLPRTTVSGHQSLEHQNNKDDSRKALALENGEAVNSLKKGRSLVGLSGSTFNDHSDEDNDSDASTRTPSDVSLSSDYSDGESNAETGTRNKEVGHLEDEHEASGAAIESNGRVNEERDFAQEFSCETASSKEFKLSALEDLQLKAKDSVVGSKPLGADVNVESPKSSRKRKKSKKTMDLASVTPSTSVAEHVKGFLSSKSPTEHNTYAKRDHPINTLRKESDRLPEAGREMDTMSTSFLATDKEINDVIQNVVDSVQQMEKDQVGTESINGKSRKKSRKKQTSDAKLLTDSTKQNENIVTSTAEVTKKVTLVNTETAKHSVGSLIAEKDQGIKSAQLMAQKPESNAVVRCSQSRSDSANEVTGSGEILVDKTINANGAPGTEKGKKTKSKKHDAHSDGPSSGFKTPLMLDNSHGVGAKPCTGDSSSAGVQVSSKANTEKPALQSDKTPSKASDKGATPLVSSKPQRANYVPEEARRSNDAKPSGVINDSKSKKGESNLKSSKNSSLLKTTVSGHQSLEHQNHKDGRKAPAHKNGEALNSLKKGRSLVGLSGSIFNDDSDESSSNEDNDSDGSTRTPSDGSSSSDYSDGERNAVSSIWKREGGGRKATANPFGSSGMTLDKILRSSSSYKLAKLTAAQSRLEDTESQPIDFVPESQP